MTKLQHTWQILRYAGLGVVATVLNDSVFLIAAHYLVGDSKPDKLNEILVGIGALNFFLIVAIAVPIIEELLFRGPIRIALFFRKLPQWSIVTLSVISSMLFGYLHLSNYSNPHSLEALIYGAMLGCNGGIFTYVVIKTRSLTTSIVAHMAINFFGTLGLVLKS